MRVLVQSAGGPGPQAAHGPASFHRDLEHAQALASAAWATHRAQWIGEWHTHPRADLSPSERDLGSYLHHLTDPELDFDVFVSIIGRSVSGGVALAGWMITKSTVIQAIIELGSRMDAGPASITSVQNRPAPFRLEPPDGK